MFVAAADTRLPVGLSVGIASSTEDRTQKAIVEAADAAMYRAKRAGGNRIAFERSATIGEGLRVAS